MPWTIGERRARRHLPDRIALGRVVHVPADLALEARGRLEGRLRSLASSGSGPICAELGGPPTRILASGLDARSEALVRVAALVAMRAPITSY